MDFLEIVALAFICAITFFLRAMPAITKTWFGNDSFYHLIVARKFREDGSFPKTDPNLIPENPHTYPPLLQALLYPFAGGREKWALRFLSPSVDTITVLVIYFFGIWIGIREPLLLAILFAIMPPNVLDGSSLNPRPIGHLLTAIAMIGVLGFWLTEQAVLLAVIVIMESLILLCHKLSTQLLLPLHVILSGLMMFDNLTQGLMLLGSLFMAVILATIVTRGAYLKTYLPDHIRYIGVHRRLGHYRTGRIGLPSPLHLFKANPIAFATPFLGIYLLLSQTSFIAVELLLPWSVTTLVIAQFWIWGDSWRYLQLATIPGLVILLQFVDSIALDQNIVLMTILIMTMGWVAIRQLRISIWRDLAQRLADDLNSLPADWRRKLKNSNIYSNVHHYFIPFYTEGCVLLGNPSGRGNEIAIRLSRLEESSLSEIAEFARNEFELELDYYLIFKSLKEPKSNGFRVLYESDTISILERG